MIGARPVGIGPKRASTDGYKDTCTYFPSLPTLRLRAIHVTDADCATESNTESILD